jgi:hypothetical protein
MIINNIAIPDKLNLFENHGKFRIWYPRIMEIWLQAFYVLEINVKYSEFLLQKAILMVASGSCVLCRKNIDRIVTYCEKIRLL